LHAIEIHEKLGAVGDAGACRNPSVNQFFSSSGKVLKVVKLATKDGNVMRSEPVAE
jgi:hypothetical protein